MVLIVFFFVSGVGGNICMAGEEYNRAPLDAERVHLPHRVEWRPTCWSSSRTSMAEHLGGDLRRRRGACGRLLPREHREEGDLHREPERVSPLRLKTIKQQLMRDHARMYLPWSEYAASRCGKVLGDSNLTPRDRAVLKRRRQSTVPIKGSCHRAGSLVRGDMYPFWMHRELLVTNTISIEFTVMFCV